LRAFSERLEKVTRPLLGRQGLAVAGLLHDWPDIVGEELAAVSLPRKISFPRRDRRSDGTLVLRVAPGHAILLQHLQGPICERVNGYLGYAAVTRLRLMQGPLALRAARPQAVPARLSPAREAALAAKTGEIEDEALRAALNRLGRAVLAGRPRDEPGNTET
jgi:hypothetical protein